MRAELLAAARSIASCLSAEAAEYRTRRRIRVIMRVAITTMIGRRVIIVTTAIKTTITVMITQ